MDEDLVVRVFGQDLSILREKADELYAAISEIDGVDPLVDLGVEEPTVEVEVDLEAAQQHGIKPRRSSRGGHVAVRRGSGNLFEEQKVFDVVVWGAPQIRQSVTDIPELVLDTPSGDHVRLGDVAEVRVVSAPTVIHRDSVARIVDVAFNVSGRDAGDVMADVERVIADTEFPVEYHAELLGPLTDERDAGPRTLAIAIAAAVGICCCCRLLSAAGGWRSCCSSRCPLPSRAEFWRHSRALGLSPAALLGLLTVLATVRPGILLIRQYRDAEFGEPDDARTDIVRQTTQERFRPSSSRP